MACLTGVAGCVAYCAPACMCSGVAGAWLQAICPLTMPNVSTHHNVFRIKELADKEADIDKKMGLRKIFRTLQGVSSNAAMHAGCA